MLRQITFLSLLVSFLTLSSTVFAGGTIRVCWDGSGDYTTIQAGIDAAVNGDEVVVAEGTYTGTGNRDIDFGGKAITVRSTDPNDPAVVAATVIDCEGSGRGFCFNSGETSSSVVAGLTVTGGAGVFCGGGIYCDDTNPTISHCIIKANSATHGGGIRCDGINRSPAITHCTITGNSVSRNGGGIACHLSRPTITHCVITDNSAGPSSLYGGFYGGGIYNSTTASITVSHCIVWGNTAKYGPQISSIGGSISYNDIQGGYSGTGNINADPRFVDPAAGDYHLLADSPCRDSGDPVYSCTSGETDIDGEPRVIGIRVDIGADEFADVTSGPIIEISPTEFVFYSYAFRGAL